MQWMIYNRAGWILYSAMDLVFESMDSADQRISGPEDQRARGSAGQRISGPGKGLKRRTMDGKPCRIGGYAAGRESGSAAA